MLKLIIIGIVIIFIILAIVYILRMFLKHNLSITSIKISAKFTGLDIEIKSKQKDAPSEQD